MSTRRKAATDALPKIVPQSREDLTPKRVVRLLLYVLGVVIVGWHLYYAVQGTMPRQQHANIHLGLLMIVFYLSTIELEPDGWRDHIHNGISVTLLAAIAGATAYVHLNFWRWLNEARQQLVYTNADLAIGAIIMLITIHATWRAYGRLLGFVVVFGLFYGWAGPLFPGILFHGGFGIERLVYNNSVAIGGVYGFILGVGSTWVAVFILFAGIIEGYGGLDYVTRVGQNIGDRLRSGVVQVAVVSSMLMGSITGSSAANVATTGSFTIPLMRENGVEGKYAASIESIASTGGQILPPVMGSAAFLMADILGVSFFSILQSAILPALLFYITVAFVVHIAAIKNGWQTDSDSLVDDQGSDHSILETLVDTFPYTGPLFVLIYTLVILRYDPMSAGMYGILSAILGGIVRDLVLDGGSFTTVKAWTRRTIEGCKVGAENMAPLTAVLASLGMVVSVITQSGFTQRFSLRMISLAGGVFILVLLLAMFASILFGMGMPTPAAYVVVAILTAPGLVRLGIQPITAHMFVFYFALLSTITPPVALSCAVGAGIAEASFLDVAKETMRLGVFAFVIPFTFVLNQELIYWEGFQTFTTFVAISIGLILMGIALVGYNLSEEIPLWRRPLYLGLAGAIFFVQMYTVKLGLAVLGAVWLAVLLVRTRRLETVETATQ
jgi:TRAP transporter 4TM/12TM fusion protein